LTEKCLNPKFGGYHNTVWQFIPEVYDSIMKQY